jgi:hypothetical protein
LWEIPVAKYVIIGVAGGLLVIVIILVTCICCTKCRKSTESSNERETNTEDDHMYHYAEPKDKYASVGNDVYSSIENQHDDMYSSIESPNYDSQMGEAGPHYITPHSTSGSPPAGEVDYPQIWSAQMIHPTYANATNYQI